LDPLGHNSRVGPILPFGGLACGLVLGPLPSLGLINICSLACGGVLKDTDTRVTEGS